MMDSPAQFLATVVDLFGYQPKTWGHRRELYASASQIGLCAKRQGFMMLADGTLESEKPDAWGVFARGDTGEDWMCGVLDRAQVAEYGGPKIGLAFSYTGSKQQTIIDQQARLAATPDGIMWLGSEPVLLEFKTHDPRIKLERPKAAHARQVQFAMALMHRVHTIRPERAVILYLDCANYANVTAFDVPRDEIEGKALLDRARYIQTTKVDDLPPEGALDGGSECQTCDFAEQCKAGQVARVEKADSVSSLPDEMLQDLDELAAQREAGAAVESEGKAVKDDVTRQIRLLMDEQGVSFAQTENYAIRQSVVKGRETCDWRRAVEDGVDLSDYITVSNGHPKLTVSKRKG